MGLFDWQPIPDAAFPTDEEVYAQVGQCPMCGGPGDGSACDHREDGRPWWSSQPDPDEEG